LNKKPQDYLLVYHPVTCPIETGFVQSIYLVKPEKNGFNFAKSITL